MIKRDEKIDIYNWYKRTGNISLVADLFGRDRDYVRSIVNERRAYYRDRLAQITAMPKVYLRFQNTDEPLEEDSDIVEIKAVALTKEFLHKYHKEQTKQVSKSKTKRKSAKAVKLKKTAKPKTEKSKKTSKK